MPQRCGSGKGAVRSRRQPAGSAAEEIAEMQPAAKPPRRSYLRRQPSARAAVGRYGGASRFGVSAARHEPPAHHVDAAARRVARTRRSRIRCHAAAAPRVARRVKKSDIAAPRRCHRQTITRVLAMAARAARCRVPKYAEQPGRRRRANMLPRAIIC